MLFSFSTNSQLGYYAQFYNIILVYNIISYKMSCRKPSDKKSGNLSALVFFYYLHAPCFYTR